MTYLQKALLEHPEFSKGEIIGGFCPEDFEYSEDGPFGCHGDCDQCWAREIPETEPITNEEAAKQSTLRPCPFCGGEAELVKDVRCEGFGDYSDNAYVQCTKCNSRGPSFSNWFNDKNTITEDAITGWNGRSYQ